MELQLDVELKELMAMVKFHIEPFGTLTASPQPCFVKALFWEPV